MDDLREACARIAVRARYVRIDHQAIPDYARSLPLGRSDPADADAHLLDGDPEELAAFWLTLDAINFGSGWFPTLRKPQGHSGYFTIATALRARFADHGPWSAAELGGLDVAELARVLRQEPDHELMELYAASLRDLGEQLERHYAGRFGGPVRAARGSAIAFVSELARWQSFADVSFYDGIRVPFLKRAQIAASDLARAGVGEFHDLARLTMFADNLVPHVLRLDGILSFEPELVARIEREELLEHGSAEEVEIRACAVNAVELIVSARREATAAEVDSVLWTRGSEARYKAVPRHRCRCAAY